LDAKIIELVVAVGHELAANKAALLPGMAGRAKRFRSSRHQPRGAVLWCSRGPSPLAISGISSRAMPTSASTRSLRIKASRVCRCRLPWTSISGGKAGGRLDDANSPQTPSAA
jgi:hypothetical protein